MMWHQRRAIGEPKRPPQVTEGSVKRLKMEKRLLGHEGCVNCLEWSSSGHLLASGSDDRKLIVWNPYKNANGERRAIIDTRHRSSIHSVKFMPHSRDEQLGSCAADGQVQVTQLCQPQPLLSCHSCHSAAVKRLATHPDEPHLIWSAGEDGLINQYDIRQAHTCLRENAHRHAPNTLIDLRRGSGSMFGAKCLAFHPLRKETLAVGTNDPFVRLFDRRYLSRSHPSVESQVTTHFAPGHLVLHNSSSHHQPSCLHSYGTTSLSFSADGSQLLANYHAEQVYLFSTNQPWERYKSFETVAGLVFGDRACAKLAPQPAKTKPCREPPPLPGRGFAPWKRLLEAHQPDRCGALRADSAAKLESVRAKLASKLPISLAEMDELNKLLAGRLNCPQLLNLRAAALIQRNWRGDCYLAIRDCCCCLALERFNFDAIESLARASQKLDDRLCVERLLAALEAFAKTLAPEVSRASSEIKRLINVLSGISRRSPSIVAANYASTMQIFFRPNNEDDQHASEDMLSDEEQSRSSRSSSTASAPTNWPISWSADNRHEPNKCHLFEEDQKHPLALQNCHDFTASYTGHSNISTDIKEASFFGERAEYIVAGSDDGAYFIWNKNTCNLVKAVQGDSTILNCLQPHPSVCLLATSGIDSCIKLWSPSGRDNCDVHMLERRCTQNQNYMSADPFDALISHISQPGGPTDEEDIW